MNQLTHVRHVVNKLFTKHLFVTNVATCGTLLGLGDCVVQHITMAFHSDKTLKYDFPRTGRMIVIGFTLGPFNHYWYSFLDRVLVGRTGKTVLYKIICDQFVAGPFFCTSFLFGINILEGKGLEAATKEWKEKFLQIYMADWIFWPAAQFVNFRFIPNNFRVLYVSTATLMWNSFLSYMKHGVVDPDDEGRH